jgi:hypothetical protein
MLQHPDRPRLIRLRDRLSTRALVWVMFSILGCALVTGAAALYLNSQPSDIGLWFFRVAWGLLALTCATMAFFGFLLACGAPPPTLIAQEIHRSRLYGWAIVWAGVWLILSLSLEAVIWPNTTGHWLNIYQPSLAMLIAFPPWLVVRQLARHRRADVSTPPGES